MTHTNVMSRARPGTVRMPLFIRVGDTIKIDTRTHEYVERIERPGN